MDSRVFSRQSVGPLGLGCMNLNHAYGAFPSPEAARRLLVQAVDSGVVHFDTAALYGFGANEELVGQALAPYRERIFLASKCGMTGVDGRRIIDGRPETIRRTCEQALRRLRTDHIDLYYLHRVDREVALEQSLDALARLVQAGHVRHIGLSEVSAATLRRAHALYPIAAVQNEYSLWSRNAELGVLETSRELGIAFVAFSPLGRGFLTDAPLDPQQLEPRDLRRTMPRFQPPHFAANLRLRATLQQLAREAQCSAAQLALYWLLSRSANLVAIPGTTSVVHLDENLAAAGLEVEASVLERLDAAINARTVSGARYPPATLAEIDTEET